MGKITKDRWQRAQIAERKYHKEPKEVLLKMYDHAYSEYFRYLGMDRDLKGKSIIEIGPADVPALYYCNNGKHQTIIEPMPSSILVELMPQPRNTIVVDPAESTTLGHEYDEVWLFNVLQHVIDPNKVIENAKKWAKTIRFFEPIDMGTTEAHPHSFTLEDFKNWFGDCTQLYDYNNEAKGFHQNRCAYGTWTGNT